MEPKNPAKILIVGAGIFGVSTAYHLAKRIENASDITLLDRAPLRSNTLGASSDINKIIRADYSSPLYMDLGLEAIDAWKTSPLYKGKGVYCQSGWIAMDEKGSEVPRLIRENFGNLKAKKNGNEESEIVDMSEEQVRKSWGGVLARTDCSPFGSYYFNQSAGWADAKRALDIMLQEAIELGVKYEVGEVERIVASEGKGGVVGVKTKDGNLLCGAKVLLATGAWTSQVMANLEDELDLESDGRVEGQVSAAAVCVAHFQLTEEEKEVYSKLPVLVYGGQGEVIPPTSTGILKFTSTISVKNTVQTATGHEISVPAEDQSYAPQGLQEDMLASVRARLPQFLDDGRKPDSYRLCWDSISANQHPVIARHPDHRLDNLYLAVGGSFHFYKFLPTVGKYVANVLDGVGNGTEKDEMWSWKKESTGTSERGVHASLVPKREFKDFL
ncbi:FAD dependent oxidoreductase [Aspergillus californicus]